MRECYKYNLLGLENILLDYSNIYVRILNVLYSMKIENGQSIFIDNSLLNKELKRSIHNYINNKEIYNLKLYNAKDNYEIYKILSKTYSFERVLLVSNLKFKYKVYNYERNIKIINLVINGQHIKKIRCKGRKRNRINTKIPKKI